MKATLPLSAEDATSVLSRLNVAVPALDRATYTSDELDRELVRPEPDLRGVCVHKQRAHYLVDGCMVELTELSADGAATRTIAVESPDPTLVSATIHTLRLDGRRNINVARGLKALVGFGAQRYAVIDVGTNSVKFFLAERQADGEVRTVADRAEITRLGEGLAHRAGSPTRAIQPDGRRHRRHDRRGATERSRGHHGGRHRRAAQAPNRDEFIDAVRRRAASPSRSSRARRKAVSPTSRPRQPCPRATGPLVVFDSGGGSTPVHVRACRQVEERFSVDVGAVRVRRALGLAAPVRGRLEAALAAMAADLDRLDGTPSPTPSSPLAAPRQTWPRSSTARAYDPDVVQGTVLDLPRSIARSISTAAAMPRSAADRRAPTGTGRGHPRGRLHRAHDPGQASSGTLTVSDRGMRHGLFIDRFAQDAR